MTSRYLITGGAGFIGSHLADALLGRDAEVVVLDDLSTGRLKNLDARVRMVEGDVLDAALVQALAKDCAGIFHLAAIASVPRCNDSWIQSHAVNQTGTVTVLQASRSLGGIPVVYASSAAVYGDQSAERIAEGCELRPLSSYGADKLGGELHGRVAHSLFGVPNIGLRFFNVYGPRQDASSPYSGVISIFVARASENAPLTIFGDGQQLRDFVFVGDVVSHLVQAMSIAQRPQGASGVFNVCTGRGHSVAELAQLVIELVHSRSTLVHAPGRAGDIKTSVGDPSEARRVLGLAAEVPLHAGLVHLLQASH